MERIQIHPRNNWQHAVEQLGFGFHTNNIPYWDESAYYSFDMDEILRIEDATAELWQMCLAAVQYAIDHRLLEQQFHIPAEFVSYVERTWNEDHPSIYGRFDLCYKNGEIKLLEFNADTPTSLYEAGIVQWFWLQDLDASKDQFNSIHEKLIEYWRYTGAYLHPGTLHFSCVKQSLEDLTNTEYLRDCAMQAGLTTKLVYVDDIGWDDAEKVFVDMEELPIQNLFKLYPWEWMVREEFANHIAEPARRPLFIEPAWKMVLSNKAILPLLWKLYPRHPYLLPAYFEDGILGNYAKKPILSREGANITLVSGNETLIETDGEYGEEGFIYQELFELPDYEGNHPVIGSWVIGQQPAGIGIRESKSPVTDNFSRFIPHLIANNTFD
ncbi:MAG TPA: glutathionylspermidine synthase family protein [Puia sp.]|nr:glutathionylspermidine synthase family protein [Puia sp.]